MRKKSARSGLQCLAKLGDGKTVFSPDCVIEKKILCVQPGEITPMRTTMTSRGRPSFLPPFARPIKSACKCSWNGSTMARPFVSCRYHRIPFVPQREFPKACGRDYCKSGSGGGGTSNLFTERGMKEGRKIDSIKE